MLQAGSEIVEQAFVVFTVNVMQVLGLQNFHYITKDLPH